MKSLEIWEKCSNFLCFRISSTLVLSKAINIFDVVAQASRRNLCRSNFIFFKAFRTEFYEPRVKVFVLLKLFLFSFDFYDWDRELPAKRKTRRCFENSETSNDFKYFIIEKEIIYGWIEFMSHSVQILKVYPLLLCHLLSLFLFFALVQKFL